MRASPVNPGVMWPVTLRVHWDASTKRCKDAGSAHSPSMGATEDAAARRVIACQGAGVVAGRITNTIIEETRR